MAEPDREAYEAAERLVREAHAKAEEAARAAAQGVPPNGWSSGERPARGFPDLNALLALVDAARGALPPELARQLADALRELLIAHPRRARLLDRAARAPAAHRARGGGHPDPMSPRERRFAACRRSCSSRRWRPRRSRSRSCLPWYQKSLRRRARSRPGQRQRARRVHVRRGRDPARRGRGAVPRLGALAPEGLPPARRRRRRDHARRRLGRAAARLALFDKPDIEAPAPRWASSGASSARCSRRAR